jgi:hypothetical protein
MTRSSKDSSSSTTRADRFFTGIFGWLTLLRAQALALILLILMLMVTLTAGVAYLAFQQVSQSLAESRDQELVVVGAGRLSGRLENLWNEAVSCLSISRIGTAGSSFWMPMVLWS